MGNTDRKLITDEEIAQNPNMYRDEDGVHLKIGRGDTLIEPSESWLTRQKEIEQLPTIIPPTETEILRADSDFIAESVSSAIENTEVVAEGVAFMIDDSIILAETLSFVLDELESVKQELATLKGVN